MANKRLNATITIGGGVGRTLTKGLTSTKARLGEVGESIRTVERRQKTLGKSIDTFGRMGKNVDGLRREYGQLTGQMERLRRTQEQLLRVERARARVSGAYSNFTGEVGKSVRTLRTASLAAIGVGGSMVALTSKVATTGDEVAKTSRAIGFNAQSFQKYQFAAERVGVAQGTFNQSLTAFGKRLGELKTRGSGALATQLKEMNPALYETLKATESTEAAFEIYIQAMRESTDASERNAMASAAFSRAGLKMGLIAQTSSEEIQRLKERAEELGYVLGDKDLAAAEKFTDEMTNMQTAMGGVGKLVGAELMPVMSKFFNRFTAFVIENRESISVWAKTIAEKTEAALPSIIKAATGIGQALMAAGRLTGKLASLVGGFDNLAIIMVGLKFAPLIISSIKLVGALGSMATAMPMVAAGIKAIGLALTANPIGIIVMAIAGAAFLIYKYWEPIKGFFSGLWNGVKSIFSGAIDGIKTILGWTPLSLITNNWSGITDVIGGIWDNVTNMTKKAVDWVSSKLEWVGKTAKKVTSFFGFGGSDDEPSESEQSTTRTSPARAPGAVIARAEAPQPSAQNRELGTVVSPMENSRPSEPAREAREQQSTTNNRTSNQRSGDTFTISISQNAGEDPETLARRVVRIIQQQRRESESGALYDQPAGA
jgi:hypothetical protein